MGTLSCLDESLHGLHPTSVLYLFDDDIRSVLAEHGRTPPSLLVEGLRSMFIDDGTDVSLLNDPTLITEGEGETRDQLEHKERACF